MRRSKFSLSHRKLYSCDAGELIPCGLVEVLPGDSIQQNTSLLIRASPMLAPVMHPVEARIHHWFVPHRLVWEEFESFVTGGSDGMDAQVFPTRSMSSVLVGSLADYLGVPLSGGNVTTNALPFRGYQTIWNEFYRDEDLETAASVRTISGAAETTTSVTLQHCAWEKDYFTSSRPWEQKGPSITIPLGTSAPVVGLDSDITFHNETDATDRIFQTGAGASMGNRAGLATAASGDADARWGDTALEADLTGASAITINLLREALALQRFEEARARFGSRYVEYLRYLGVRSSDARLSRPEYLGGGKQLIQFSEVLQTAEGTQPVGEMRGHGIGVARSNRYRRFFEEHGYIFTLVSIRPKTIYMQGLSRTWNRRVKEDFWQKELEGIGQQEVLNKEVYMAHASPDGVFGYQDRYDEYRRMESSVGGEFRTSTLNFWHMAREFSSDPALNATFVKCVPTERTFAVPSEDVYYVMAKHSIQARRLVSQTGRSYTF